MCRGVVKEDISLEVSPEECAEVLVKDDTLGTKQRFSSKKSIKAMATCST